MTEAQVSGGITLRKAANSALEKVFTASSGVTNETIRKNKAMECLKTIFPHRSIIPVTANDSSSKLVAAVKRKAVAKNVCGKAINGNMLLALSLEYAETLSQPVQSIISLPGAKSSTMHSLLLLFQAYSRVAEEETMRISDTVLAGFEEELDSLVNDQTMPLPDKTINKIFKKLEAKYKDQLRQNLAEIATFDEVMHENDKIEERMRQRFEAKRSTNYSQGYYFSLGLLKQLYKHHFSEASGELLTAEGFKEKWLALASDLCGEAGEQDSQAKWDVFAECFIRLPAEVQARFVNYSKVENEQATDLAAETADTMETEAASTCQSTVPTDLLNQHLQVMSLIEDQIEAVKSGYQERLTESQVKAQQTL